MDDLQHVDRRSVTQASISVKVSIETKRKFCDMLSQEGSSPNEFFKRVINEKISGDATPFESFRLDYDPKKDCFNWIGLKANGPESIPELLAQIPPDTAEYILKTFVEAVKVRQNHMETRKPSSMASIAKSIKKLNKRRLR